MKRLEEVKELEELVQEVLSKASCDRRQVYAEVSSLENTIQLLCSDREILQLLLPRLRERLQETPIQGVELPSPELRARTAWMTASVADVRARPQHSAEQTTQALQGEEVTPLFLQDGWLLGRMTDGYLGWIREWHLQLVPPGLPGQFQERSNARILSASTKLHEAPSRSAAVCAETILGTAVVLHEHSGEWVEIELPGGRRGWLPVIGIRQGTAPWPSNAQAILESLQRFFGVPYVWGGRSPKGFDCSGLVQFVYALHGIDLPRDSDQQFECGEPVRDLLPADLLFFGRETIAHVAVVIANETFIHARGEVRLNALTAESPLHDPELAKIYRGARRVLTQTS